MKVDLNIQKTFNLNVGAKRFLIRSLFIMIDKTCNALVRV